MSLLYNRLRQYIATHYVSLGIFLSFLASGALIVPIAGALGINYWDDVAGGTCDIRLFDGSADACVGNQVRLIVGQDQYVQKTGVKVNAYFHSDHGKLSLPGINFCAGSKAGEDYSYGLISIPDGTAISHVTARQGDGTLLDSLDGNKYGSGDGRCDPVPAKTLVLNNLTKYNSTLWFATIEVSYTDQKAGACTGSGGGGSYGGCDGIQNTFRLVESSDDPSNNAVIATVGDQSDGLNGFRTTAQQVAGGANDYLTYAVRFGTPCTIPNGTTAQLRFYDLDLSGGSGAQPPGHDITMDLKRVDDSGNEIQVKHWDQSDIGSAPNTVGSVEYTNFKPGERYIWLIKNLYYNNTLQFSTPYDGIFYYSPCKNSEVSPIVSMSPADVATVGQTVTTDFKIINKGDNTANVRYTPIYWLENVNGSDGVNPTYNPPADTLVSGHGGVNNQLQGAVDIPDGVTKTVQANWTGSVANVAQYKSICAKLVLSNPADGTSITDNPVANCVPIGKQPTLQVQNGDVRTGGRFPNADNSPCTVTPSLNPDYDDGTDKLGSFSVIGHNFGGSSAVGSWAGNGIFSTGRVINFGSNGVSVSTGNVSKYLTFANTLYAQNSNDGYFYNASDGAASSDVTTSCFSNVLNGKYADGTTIPINGSTPVHVDVTTDGPVTYDFREDNQTLIIDGGTVPRGNQRIIHVTNSTAKDNDVIEIDNNIILKVQSYSNISNLPSFVLLSNGGKVTTRVLNQVTQLDGIYAVNGDFNTCDAFHWTTGTNQLGAGPSCNNQLKINGILMVGRQLYPYRTAGQNTAGDTSPAETVDLRPDVLLGDYARGSSGGGLSTVYQTELPPRF